MKLTIKTLKGGKFEVECDPSQSVLEVKGLIESSNAELPAANMKLIHSGKVLKDDQIIEKCEIKPNDFLVVMVTKPKKAAAAAPAPAAPAPAAATAPAPVATGTTEKDAATTAPAGTPKASSAAETSTDGSKTAATETPAAAPAAVDAPGAPSRDSGSEFSEEVVSNLTSMGFPEDMVLACLRASNGNADVAVEFLTNGIPPGMESGSPSSAQSPARSSSSGGTLSGLRNHPQFNDLRRLVQSNPAMLQNVLTQIGQQQPELLAEINANQELFLQMMNEPINEQASAPVAQSGSSGGTSGGGGPLDGIPPGMMEGMANPAQMAQLIQNMSPNELNQMATMMGLSPDQLRTTAQMLQQIPPEQLNEYMAQAMQGGGGMGGGGGGPQVLRLTEEEMAAVNRLADMGFDRTEAAQAYLACDKNEALAANLLMDGGFGGDGGGFGFDDNTGNDGAGGSGGDGNNDGDDMYD
eukprot:CAMPEP_0113459894 /NCGR_PEP_ID=MMETSP0014_2-20120614/10700_1 /TAXON_ID=2857 /ORGANISM="Nitzschia sp." /LENGTH=466 /DNA_ID=CAMNT_0000351517 /DNA_START=104 /DNA_END=1504 /DNA_ORIENTATION=+ /assembly_acc=CAM_ASM_000159